MRRTIFEQLMHEAKNTRRIAIQNVSFMKFTEKQSWQEN